MFSNRPKNGFTMIELVIYIGISTIVLLSMLSFTWNIIGTEVKVNISTELTQNARLSMDRFTQSVQAADSINNGSSTFGSNPGVLYLNYTSGDIVIDTYETEVEIGGTTTTITKLRLKEGFADAVDLTSDHVTVNDYTLTNLSRGADDANVKMELEIEYINVSNYFPWNTTLTIETSATIRER